MNREIKFRGKRIRNGEWVYGCLTRYSEHMSYITVDLVEGEIYRVLTETVGQYTGLKDINDKEIYEGDIVNSHKIGFNYKVDFRDGAFYGGEHYIHKIVKYFVCEVIGDVYSNPELLEVNND